MSDSSDIETGGGPKKYSRREALEIGTRVAAGAAAAAVLGPRVLTPEKVAASGEKEAPELQPIQTEAVEIANVKLGLESPFLRNVVVEEENGEKNYTLTLGGYDPELRDELYALWREGNLDLNIIFSHVKGARQLRFKQVEQKEGSSFKFESNTYPCLSAAEIVDLAKSALEDKRDERTLDLTPEGYAQIDPDFNQWLKENGEGIEKSKVLQTYYEYSFQKEVNRHSESTEQEQPIIVNVNSGFDAREDKNGEVLFAPFITLLDHTGKLRVRSNGIIKATVEEDENGNLNARNETLYTPPEWVTVFEPRRVDNTVYFEASSREEKGDFVRGYGLYRLEDGEARRVYPPEKGDESDERYSHALSMHHISPRNDKPGILTISKKWVKGRYFYERNTLIPVDQDGIPDVEKSTTFKIPSNIIGIRNSVMDEFPQHCIGRWRDDGRLETYVALVTFPRRGRIPTTDCFRIFFTLQENGKLEQQEEAERVIPSQSSAFPLVVDASKEEGIVLSLAGDNKKTIYADSERAGILPVNDQGYKQQAVFAPGRGEIITLEHAADKKGEEKLIFHKVRSN